MAPLSFCLLQRDLFGKSTSSIYSFFQFSPINQVLNLSSFQFFQRETAQIRNAMIYILMHFDKDPSLLKTDFYRLVDDMHGGSHRDDGIKPDDILRVKSDTPMGDQASHCPGDVGAVYPVPIYG